MLGLLGARNVPAASVLRLMERLAQEAELVRSASQAREFLLWLETPMESKAPSNAPRTDGMIARGDEELRIHVTVSSLFHTGKPGRTGQQSASLAGMNFLYLVSLLLQRWSSELCAGSAEPWEKQGRGHLAQPPS